MGRGYGYSGGGMGMSYGGGADAVFHLIFGALFFIILVAIAVILIRLAVRGGRSR